MTAAATPGLLQDAVHRRFPRYCRAWILRGRGFRRVRSRRSPVVIEDPGRFREIFGDDLDLAWDPGQGRMVQSYLGAAVRAFLRNGGRRCWVVRVAEAPATADFLLPGMLAWSSTTGFAGARCSARSPGSWAVRLRINTTLTELAVAQGEAPQGSLLRVRFAETELTGFRAAV